MRGPIVVMLGVMLFAEAVTIIEFVGYSIALTGACFTVLHSGVEDLPQRLGTGPNAALSYDFQLRRVPRRKKLKKSKGHPSDAAQRCLPTPYPPTSCANRRVLYNYAYFVSARPSYVLCPGFVWYNYAISNKPKASTSPKVNMAAAAPTKASGEGKD